MALATRLYLALIHDQSSLTLLSSISLVLDSIGAIVEYVELDRLDQFNYWLDSTLILCEATFTGSTWLNRLDSIYFIRQYHNLWFYLTVPDSNSMILYFTQPWLSLLDSLVTVTVTEYTLITTALLDSCWLHFPDIVSSLLITRPIDVQQVHINDL